jgi:hypothetical protein
MSWGAKGLSPSWGTRPGSGGTKTKDLPPSSEGRGGVTKSLSPSEVLGADATNRGGDRIGREWGGATEDLSP